MTIQNEGRIEKSTEVMDITRNHSSRLEVIFGIICLWVMQEILDGSESMPKGNAKCEIGI